MINFLVKLYLRRRCCSRPRRSLGNFSRDAIQRSINWTEDSKPSDTAYASFISRAYFIFQKMLGTRRFSRMHRLSLEVGANDSHLSNGVARLWSAHRNRKYYSYDSFAIVLRDCQHRALRYWHRLIPMFALFNQLNANSSRASFSRTARYKSCRVIVVKRYTEWSALILCRTGRVFSRPRQLCCCCRNNKLLRKQLIFVSRNIS